MSEEGSSVGLEIGDKVMIMGGVLDRTIGVLYGFRPDRILILPTGVTDSVKRIPLTEDQVPEEEMGIEEIKLVRKVIRPGFVSLVDMKAGYMAETFGPDSKPTGTFMVESVNEEEDSAVFKTETGELMPLSFNFMGIPEGVPFEVIRIRDPPAVREENAGVAPKLEGETEDDADKLEGNAEAEAEAEEDDDDFVMGNVVVLPKQKTIGQIGSAFRIVQDVFQRQDLLSQLIQSLPSDQQRNPLILQEIRRKVETLLFLRNKVVEYGKAGEPLGLKLTSVTTVAELLEHTHVPLSRKVVPLQKVLFTPHIPKRAAEEIPFEMEGGSIRVEYLSDIVQEAAVKQEEMEVEDEVPSIGLPTFFVKLEGYRKAIQSPYLMRDGKVLQEDQEVFRNQAPYTKPIPGLIPSQPSKGGPPATKAIPYSVVRMVKPRMGRFIKTDEPLKVVEAGDTPTYSNNLLFPRSCLLEEDTDAKPDAKADATKATKAKTRTHSILREFGPIRSGFLAQDISLAMSSPQLISNILKSLGAPTEFPDINSILSFGVEGSISEHIELTTWLKEQAIFLYGTGNLYEKLSGYSLDKIELDLAQQDVVNEKIKQTYAALRIFLSDQQEKNKVLATNTVFKPQNLLTEEGEKRLVGKVAAEPILNGELETLRDKIGTELAAVGVNWFSYLYTENPDLLLSVLGEQAYLVTKYRREHLRDLYLKAIYNDYLVKQLTKNAGILPTVNKCGHVRALQGVYKVNVAAGETKDSAKMKKYVDLLEEYRGETKENWIWCRVCKEHLICQHELLLLQEYLRPKEKDVLHKELLLHFAGGQFAGKFICKECGKAISDLDFDTGMEFDDQGRPMMGRAVMEDKDEVEMQRIQQVLNGPTSGEEEFVEEKEDEEEEIDTAFDKNPELILMYKSLKTVVDKIGIEIGLSQYKTLVGYLSEYLITIPTRAAYLELKKAEGNPKPQDYDVYKAIRYVCAVACVILLFLQTNIPDFTNYYTFSPCSGGITGFPLESEENETGLECVATLISSIDEKEYPWNTSTLQKYKEHAKRRTIIKPFIKGLLKEYFLQIGTHQALLKKKREYLKDLGVGSSAKRDEISKTFRPIPYMVTDEDATKAPVYSETATPEMKAAGWILSAHSIAKKTGGTSTTTCLHSITSPDGFWSSQTLPPLPAKTAIIGTNATKFATAFVPTLRQELTGSVKEEDYYKLFMDVCYQGDNKGLPHELGIGLTCLQCGLSFQENPHLPTVMDPNPAVQRIEEEAARTRKQAFLKSKGVEINKEAFIGLLTSAHRRLAVKTPVLPTIPKANTIIHRLEQIPYPPFPNWKNLLKVTHAAILELSSPTQVQIATAAEPLVQKIVEAETFISGRVPSVFQTIVSMVEQDPRECMESLRTYVLIPFQRWMDSSNSYDSFRLLGTYKLSKDTENDIKGYYDKTKKPARVKGLGRHLQTLSDVKLEGLLLLKTKQFVKELAYITNSVLPHVRSILVPGGSYMVGYIQRALIMGCIKDFMDPHSVPDTEEELDKTVNIQLLYVAIAEAFERFATSNRIPSEKEIRTRLEERVEAEKQKFIGEMDKMSPQRRKLELTMKSLGIGKWAVGGTAAIKKYNPERYEEERVERAQAGLVDYAVVGDGGQGQAAAAGQAAGQGDDMFGIIGGEENVNDGYDHDQTAEEDY